MDMEKIKNIESNFFSLNSSERLFLLRRISSRMSPYNPVEGPVVTFFPAKHSGMDNFDVDFEREITDAIDQWDKVPYISPVENS